MERMSADKSRKKKAVVYEAWWSPPNAVVVFLFPHWLHGSCLKQLGASEMSVMSPPGKVKSSSVCGGVAGSSGVEWSPSVLGT